MAPDLERLIASASDTVGNDAPARVLLVDDRQDNLIALQAVLEPLELNVLTATSGTDALRLLLDEEVDAILLDVQMPEMDGFETAALLKTRAATRSIPILFLTASGANTANQLRGYEVGGFDYITKPFDPAVLRAKVQSIVGWSAELRGLARVAHLYHESAAAISAAADEPPTEGLADFVVMTRLIDREIPASLQAPGLARAAVREALGEQLEEVAETALLLVSELVTNAVMHARSSAELHVELGTTVLRVEVIDRGEHLPELSSPEDDAESGRGLQMVRQLTDRFGWTRLSTGKAVWFEMDFASAAAR